MLSESRGYFRNTRLLKSIAVIYALAVYAVLAIAALTGLYVLYVLGRHWWIVRQVRTSANWTPNTETSWKDIPEVTQYERAWSELTAIPASPTSWKREPFKEGVSIPYQATFES